MWIIKDSRPPYYFAHLGDAWVNDRTLARRFAIREDAKATLAACVRSLDGLGSARVVKLVPRRKGACRCDAAKAVAKVESGGTVLMNALDAKTFAADLKRLLRIEEAARAWVDCDGTPGSIVRTNNALRAALEVKP